MDLTAKQMAVVAVIGCALAMFMGSFSSRVAADLANPPGLSSNPYAICVPPYEYSRMAAAGMAIPIGVTICDPEEPTFGD